MRSLIHKEEREGELDLAIDDTEIMKLAIEEAAAGPFHTDVPVGAVVISKSGEILAKAHNQREISQDPCAHAEILALQSAAKAQGSWRLEGATIYVTLEPCPMCAGALALARIQRLVFGAFDEKAGACGSVYNICADPRLNHEVEVKRGVLQIECQQLLSGFFALKR